MIPCGKCLPCKKVNAHALSQRILDELYYHEGKGVVVTLTYGNCIDELITEEPSLSKRHCQLFIKRLRKHFKGKKIKYLLTGEYGGEYNRPHYHAVLLGLNLHDFGSYKRYNSQKYYNSNLLDSIWGNGFTQIDNLRKEGAYYVTGYLLKNTNEIEECKEKPFMLISKKLGYRYLLDNYNQINKQKCKPRYYVKKINELYYLKTGVKMTPNFLAKYQRAREYIKKHKNLSMQEALNRLSLIDEQKIINMEATERFHNKRMV